MADAVNGHAAPAMNDIEMKEETAETSVHSVPSAPEQIPTAQADQAPAIQTEPILDPNPIPQMDPASAAQPAPIQALPPQPDHAPTAMEGLLNGSAEPISTLQAQTAPPVAQPPPVSPLPATAAPPPAPVPAAAQLPTSAPTPSPAPTRPSSIPPSVSLPPEKPHPHGSPTRVFLNQAITPHLLEGMKYLAAYEPEKPLKWLSEFLAQRSAELEGEP